MTLWRRLVQFGFRLLYNELAFTYDTVSKVVSLGAWRCWQRAALKHLGEIDDGLVLELAHGTGDLQLDLNAANVRTVGCDLSPNMGRIAQRKLRKGDFPVKLVRGRAQMLPFPAGTFDAVLSTFPAPFILEPETLREVARVLRPGGRFIIVPNGLLVGGGIARDFLEWLYRITGQREEVTFDVAAHFDPYDFDTEVLREDCPRSVAQVVIARRRPSSPPDAGKML